MLRVAFLVLSVYADSDTWLIEECKMPNKGVLGSGAQGFVFKSEWGTQKIPVAVKLLGEHEASIVESLKDVPNIVKTHQLIKLERERFCWVMELMQQNTLRRVLNDSESDGLSIDYIRQVSRQILTGLKGMHDKGIAHRDMKLLNVLVDAEGNAKIADFDTCVRFVAGEKIQAVVRAGTAIYNAPEVVYAQLQGEKTVMLRPDQCDIYSFGVAFLALLMNKAPTSNHDILYAYKMAVKDRFQIHEVTDLANWNIVRDTLFRVEDYDARDLVSWMLRFLSNDRPSAEQSLAHEFFTSVKPVYEGFLRGHSVEGFNSAMFGA